MTWVRLLYDAGTYNRCPLCGDAQFYDEALTESDQTLKTHVHAHHKYPMMTFDDNYGDEIVEVCT